MKAIHLKLLLVGSLVLTGCKTETITESSLWQMLPFTGNKPAVKSPEVVAAKPTPKDAPSKPANPVVVTPVKPAAVEAPVTAPATPEPKPVATTKKSKKLPPSAPIGLPIKPSEKTIVGLNPNPEASLRSGPNSNVSPASSAPMSFRLSDWLYDEKAHEQWRQKQLDETREKEPIHRYESAQLNQAFYNLILNESATAPSAETVKP